MIKKDVIVIGGGVAGLAAAQSLSRQGLSVVVMEKENHVGGHVGRWHMCYPFEQTGAQIVESLRSDAVEVRTGCGVANIKRMGGVLAVADVEARAVIVATGYDLFDARLKEELGYGVYPRVMTSAEVEDCWRRGQLPFDVGSADAPRFAVVHCVGSRDLKCSATHCSKVCCMAGVKTAIELRQHYPTAQVTNYYMDLRMFDTAYEELYHTAQTQHHVQFVRGRVSEVSVGSECRLKLKSEDTLLGLPLTDNVEGIVLMVGMHAGGAPMVGGDEMETNANGFVATRQLPDASLTGARGVFACGACKGPRTITEAVSGGRAAALAVVEYLKAER